MDFLHELFSLAGKVAMVLGGTGTLPGAIAQGLARAGARVVVVGRNVERGRQRVAAIERDGGIAMFLPADGTIRDELLTVREETLQRWGAIDVLVNGIGGNIPEATLGGAKTFAEMPQEAWDAVFRLNLTAGAIYPCQVFGPAMAKQQRGSIINIASVSASTPLSRVGAYSSAKAAVLNLTKFLAREWAPFGVRVNALCPGFFPAAQNMSLLYKDGKKNGELTPRGEDILRHTPMKRVGEPDELVGAAVWLASSASSFVTGAEIVVDGGFSAMTI